MDCNIYYFKFLFMIFYINYYIILFKLLIPKKYNLDFD